MKNHYIFFYILSLLLGSYSNNDNIEDIIENYDLKYEESLQNYMRNYLIEKKLFKSDRIIEPNELKKIFIDILLEGASIDDVDDYTKDLNEELSNIFIKKYFKRKKEIRGKDIYDLIKINEIREKYYQLNGEIPIYDDEDDFGDFNNDL